jgi:DDE superfamily endonuclease
LCVLVEQEFGRRGGYFSHLGDNGALASVVVNPFLVEFGPIAIGAALTDTAAQVLVRIRGDRVFYTDPNHPAAGTLGRPRRHGTRFALSDPESAPVPTAELSVQDKRHGRVHVSSWTGVHPKLGCRGRWADNDHPPIVAGTVIRVDVEHLPKPSPSPPKTLWLWWSGPGEPDLDLCWRAYLRRFDIEHTFRFVKSTLGWTTSRPLDLAGRRRLHPTAPGPQARRRPPPALGTTPRTRQTHTRARPQRVSTTPPDPGHTSWCAEIRQTRTRAPKKHPTTTPNPLPSSQESRLTPRARFNRKLRTRVEIT